MDVKDPAGEALSGAEQEITIPSDREHVKEIGMALGLDAAKLDEFLKQNGFPALEAGNIRDDIAFIVLDGENEKDSIVECYREKCSILIENAEELKIMCSHFGTYQFSADLKQRMEKANVNNAELARRCFVSEATVEHWRSGRRGPRDRERLKEIGLALGLCKNELDEFLMMNGFPTLHVRNLMDNAAKIVLGNSDGNASFNVQSYRAWQDDFLSAIEPDNPCRRASARQLIDEYRQSVVGNSAENESGTEVDEGLHNTAYPENGLSAQRQSTKEQEITDTLYEKLESLLRDNQATTVILKHEWDRGIREGRLIDLVRNYSTFFSPDGTRVMPSTRLREFALLFVDDENVHKMIAEEDLPRALEKTLYHLKGERTIVLENLREKLIAFGIHSNMTLQEINLMLKTMNYSLLEEVDEDVLSAELVSNGLDMAISGIIGLAHSRYPYYEYDNNEMIRKKLIDKVKNETASRFEKKLCLAYAKSKPVLKDLVCYYVENTVKLKGAEREEEIAYLKNYTSLGGTGMMDYVHDMLTILVNGKAVENDNRAKLMLRLLRRKNL